MRDVYILGVGQTPVGEHWDVSLRTLALDAVEAAVKDAGGARPEVLYVANMLAGVLSRQQHLATLVADFAGLRGIEAAAVEAAGASGGMALRQGVLAVASGMANTALVAGVEKITDRVGPGVNAALATASDSDWEAAQGMTAAAQGALLMRRYMHEYGVQASAFAGFSVNAHANARTNPNAMYRNAITAQAYATAPMVSEPVNLLDVAPDGDGAAALMLSADPARSRGHPAIRIAASAAATDTLALHDRDEPLAFTAARLSSEKALRQAGVRVEDVGVFELHDAFSVFAALSLEALSLAEKGEGWRLAANGAIGLSGWAPMSTFGGLKARGNPGGATGLYQVVEVTLQLRGEAGPNQAPNARWGLAQCLGSAGATAVTHILQRVN